MCCNVCISKCQESRSHSTLTWVFFHLPKLLQPQLKNPEKLHTGDTRPVFHTSINSLLNHRIALNWFLFLNVTSGMNWKMYFCFSYEWTVMRYLKMSSLWLCVCVHTRSTSWLVHNRSLQTGCLYLWSKSGRPVSLTTVFADCGRLAGVFLFFWCTEMLVQIFMDKYLCVC